ncbi:hypothetical protein BKH46_08585 [Helicobacter sp. 12S02634-8]|uniref:hypothetical protein n=1 Tax=Helicobacter sp. 12S02634-8 TaxID=1476199 RepID=UPI000BA5C1A4|nr:hypothetical protein [Helicobacter sp. 12S02634-8]PAF46183.1 hypothetical protein BKH46_08585 [Helicobacter sp. 12S02634-8]
MKNIVKNLVALKFQLLAFEIEKISLKKQRKRNPDEYERFMIEAERLYEDTKKKVLEIEVRNERC